MRMALTIRLQRGDDRSWLVWNGETYRLAEPGTLGVMDCFAAAEDEAGADHLRRRAWEMAGIDGHQLINRPTLVQAPDWCKLDPLPR